MIRWTILLIPLSFLLAACAHVQTGSVPQDNQLAPSQKESSAGAAFQTPKKSAHYEGNTPAHGAILPAAPVNVVVDFNFDLAAPSSTSITKDGKEYGVGETTIDRNKLAMRRAMDPSASDGVYAVAYTACWPDKSCHDGMFQFAIDRSKADASTDRRGQQKVEVILGDIAFTPSNLRISAGTTVVWKNADLVDHYVNTDSHPAHTYEPDQNSSLLKTGQSFKYTFTKSGAYPYHCSAHAETMTGMIVVE